MSGTSGITSQTQLPSNAVKVLRQFAVAASIAAATSWAVYRSSPALLSEDFLKYAIRWPFLDAPEGTDFMRSSPTGMLMFHLVGGSGRFEFILFHIAALTASSGALAWWVARNASHGSRARSVRFVILSPVFAVLLQSIGTYDSFTLIGIVVVLFGWQRRNTAVLAAGSAYLGFQHFEQAVVLSAVWWLAYQGLQTRLPQHLQGLISPLWLVPGFLVGKLLLTLTLAAYRAPIFGSRAENFAEWIGIASSIAINRLPMTLWGGLAGLWLILLLTSASLNRSQLLRLMMAIALALVFSTTTIDNLRVFVLLTVPLAVLLIVIANNGEYARRSPLRLAAEGLMWLAPPQPTSTYALNNLHSFFLQLRSMAG